MNTTPKINLDEYIAAFQKNLDEKYKAHASLSRSIGDAIAPKIVETLTNGSDFDDQFAYSKLVVDFYHFFNEDIINLVRRTSVGKASIGIEQYARLVFSNPSFFSVAETKSAD